MIKAVIFDVDGVLLDSFESNYIFYKNLIENFGYQMIGKEDFKKFIHLSMHDAIKVLTGLDENSGNTLNLIYRKGQDPFNEARITPSVPDRAPEILSKLNRKYKLGIVTSRIKSHIFEGELQKLESLFRAAVGYEDTNEHKPSPEPLFYAAKLLNLAPDQCVYIGDMPTDLQAAKKAGMHFILYSKKDIEGASTRVENFADIPKLVESLK